MITLQEAKAQLRVEQDFTDEDDLITSLIGAAVTHAERRTGQSIAYAEGKTHVIDSFPPGRAGIELPWTPVESVTSVEYQDAAGTGQALTPAELIMDKRGVYPRLYPKDAHSWPASPKRHMGITITANVGAPSMPTDIRLAILLLVAHYYAHREAVVVGSAAAETLPLGVEMLLGPHVIHPSG